MVGDGFPSQRAGNPEKVSLSWRLHGTDEIIVVYPFVLFHLFNVIGGSLGNHLSSLLKHKTNLSSQWVPRRSGARILQGLKPEQDSDNSTGSLCQIQYITHDDLIKWKHFLRHWPFVRVIHRWPRSSPHKGQWRGALMFHLIDAWINGWVNNREAGDLRRDCAHYDVTVMIKFPSLAPGGTVPIIRMTHC